MEWIRVNLDRLLIAAAAGCTGAALAVLGYAALAITPDVALVVTLFAGSMFMVAWMVWFILRRVTRPRRDAPQLDHAR